MTKNKLSLISFFQAFGLASYCGLVAILIWQLGSTLPKMPQVLGTILLLFLLSFSVAVCGAIVFGYPCYLVINKKVKEALLLLAYILLYCLGIIAIILLVIFSFQ